MFHVSREGVKPLSFTPSSEHVNIMGHRLGMDAGLLPTTRPFDNDDLALMFDSCAHDIRGPRGGRCPWANDCDCWKCCDKQEYTRISRSRQRLR